MDGILPVHKPANMSSAQVVARIKKYLKVKKAGHTGTLDPFATGLVLVALGRATRIAQFLLKGRKSYFATILLGEETDTYDRTGQIIARASSSQMNLIGRQEVEKAVLQFQGIQEQVAPSFSALKHEGQPLYKLARKGIMVTKPPRTIEIFRIEIARMELPEVDLFVECTAGTYIRSLAHDLGNVLGCGGHLKELVRTGSGHFTLGQALDIKNMPSREILDNGEFRRIAMDKMVPMSQSISFLPQMLVSDGLAGKIRQGQPIHVRDQGIETMEEYSATNGKLQYIRVVDEKNELLAVVFLEEGSSKFRYSCVFS